MFRTLLRTGAAVVLLSAAHSARADVVYSYSSGANSATAQFKTVAGGIEITVTNTEGITTDAANAISQIQFTIGGSSLALPSQFTEIKGTVTDFQGNTSNIDVSPPTSTEHWSFLSGGSTVSLWTVDGGGLSGYGGKPTHMIVAAGSMPNASLDPQHIPSFIGPVDFFLKTSSAPGNLTLSDITSVKFSFGTGPETLLARSTGAIVIPEAPTIVGASIAMLFGLSCAWRQRLRSVG